MGVASRYSLMVLSASGMLIQEDVLVQLNAVVGVQRSFAETVYNYLDKKLME
jgi:hypothetical protein